MPDTAAATVLTCSCGQRMKLPSGLRSRTYKCVKCGTELKVPAKGGAAPNAARETPSDAVVNKRIGKILIEEELITRAQLNEALDVQRKSGGRTFQILVGLGHLDRDALHACLSKQHGVAGIDLKNYHIPANLLSLIPKEFARERVLLPIDKLGRLLTIGMACPLDENSIAQVESITGLTVKPMLCKLDDILAALDRYYPEAPPETEDGAPGADDGALTARIAGIESLPGRSATVQQVLNIIEDDESAVRSAAELIAADPCLAAGLLSVANQPAYGMAGAVTTPHLAVALLGLDGTLKVILNASKETSHVPASLEPLWARSVFTAAAAETLAQATGAASSGTAYTAGLLQDIGRFALAYLDGALYAPIAHLQSSDEIAAAERELFGMGHAEAGAALARAWGLPEDLALAIAQHGQPEAVEEPLPAIAALASLMSDAFAGRDAAHGFDPPNHLLEKLGLTARAAQAAFDQVAAEAG